MQVENLLWGLVWACCLSLSSSTHIHFTAVTAAGAVPVWIPDVIYMLMTLHNRLGLALHEIGSPLQADFLVFQKCLMSNNLVLNFESKL